MKVIVGFDSSSASDYIFQDMQLAGLPPDVDITIVSATDIEPFGDGSGEEFGGMLDPTNPVWQREISAEERGYLETMLKNAHRMAEAKTRELTAGVSEAAARVRELFPSSTVNEVVSMGSPYTAITREARNRNADLIIVGSQNASALKRFFLGSVSQKIVQQAEISVRIARAHMDFTNAAPRIIIGYDGSSDGDHAVEAVARRTWPEGTTVCVLTVAEEKNLAPMILARMAKKDAALQAGSDMPQDLVTSLALQASERLKAAGLETIAMGMVGDPKVALPEKAEEWKADTIFIGCKGHRAQKEEALGAVAHVVTTRAACSVEVVRAK